MRNWKLPDIYPKVPEIPPMPELYDLELSVKELEIQAKTLSDTINAKQSSTTNNQDDIKTDGEMEFKKTKPRKKLIPLLRNKTESLQLIYKITMAYKVEYEDDLTGSNAWGLIISGKFTSDLIKTKPKNNRDVLVLNDDETLTQADFIRKYRDRFK